MGRMNIAYLCDISPEHTNPYSGGNARMFAALSAHADVTLLPHGWGAAEPLRRLIGALPESSQLRLRWRAHLALAPAIAAPLNRALAAGRFDAVFCAYSFQSLAGLRPPPGTLTVYSSDATPAVYKRSEIGRQFGSTWVSRRLVDPLTLRAERRILSRLDLLLAPSDWFAQGAEAAYGLPRGLAQVVPWGANIDDPGRIAPPPLPGAGAPLELLLIGRDWFAKGGPVAFATMEALRARGFDTRLTVIGARPPADHCNAHVTCTGLLDKARAQDAARLAQALRNAHFLIQPSFESYGFAFCEAAAFGLPALCRDVGGIPVRDGISGDRLSTDATAEDFADRILARMADPDSYAAMRRMARTEYEERLNWNAWADSVIALIDLQRRIGAARSPRKPAA